ncbi:MAG: hypothetical protein H0W06_06810 [Chloroflexia bacterium]|nr:hypothetical protein [Chloroflexia bacterium]
MGDDSRLLEDIDTRAHRVGFRPLARADLPPLLRWLGDPDVASWYDEASSPWTTSTGSSVR